MLNGHATEAERKPDLRAIETHWRGFRFRSRLEARWAVFFDRLGLKFEYEPEGFQLADRRYLPDFFLPEIKWWAEIKPTFFTSDEQDKAFAFVKQTREPILLLDETPRFVSYFGFRPVGLPDGTEVDAACDYSLDIHRYREAFAKERRLWGQPYIDATNEEEATPHFSERYKDAVYAARAERFGS